MKPNRQRLSLKVALACIVTASACSSPTSPNSTLYELKCPASPAVLSSTGNPVVATYELPASIGGSSPFSTSCSPKSGGLFPVGTTPVSCQSLDAQRRSASCTFNVVVSPPLQLRFTKFLAFGDSITEGKIPDPISPAPTLLGTNLRLFGVDHMGILLTAAEPYPAGVQRELGTRYPLQAFTVANKGIGGEFAAEGGVARFSGVLTDSQPEVVLLMEGTNDLLDSRGADVAIPALDTMVTQALAQGRRIFLATIPPQRLDGPRAVVAARIPGFNDRVRALAAGRQIPLVDVYNAMKDDLSLISSDELHPTQRGYGVIADTFTAAIRANLEQAKTTTTVSGSLR